MPAYGRYGRRTRARPYRKRAIRTLRGYGDYTAVSKKRKRSAGRRYASRVRRYSKNWGALAAGAVKYGAPLLGAVAKLSGFGDYSASSGDLNGGNQIPIIQNTAGGCIIRHREYIGDLLGSQGFQISTFLINPGNEILFPWMANVAVNFEQWCPRGMIFEFKTTSSDTVVNVTSGSPNLGSVIMATDYNVYNPDFASKQQMENYEFAVSCKPSCNMIHQIENKKADLPLKDYYVQSSNSLSAVQGDARMSYPCKFQIATQGNTVTATPNSQNVLGELWCSYEIEFKRPRIYPGIKQPPLGKGLFDHFNLAVTGGGIMNTVTPPTPFSTLTAGMLAPSNTSTLRGALSGGIVPVSAQQVGFSLANGQNLYLPFTVQDSAGNQIPSAANTYYFPPGVSSGLFMFSYQASGFSGSAVISAYPTSFYNCQSYNLVANNATTAVSTAALTANQVILIQFIKVTGVNASFKCSFTGGPTGTPSNADVYVASVSATD